MPQLNKGGKFVFGLSQINTNNHICFPRQVISEYRLKLDRSIIIFTGSKVTGGFCVTSERLLKDSKLNHLLDECPSLVAHETNCGEFITYKGRSYAWIPVSDFCNVALPNHTLKYLNLKSGDILMCIRSSNIAFTMGAYGPLMDKVNKYRGKIELY